MLRWHTRLQYRNASTLVSLRNISRAMATNAGRNGNYAEAIAALNTLQSNAAVIEAIRKSGGKMNDYAIPEMIEYLERIGWQQSDLDKLGVIHVTGTKGKGSTSAFVDSLVRQTPRRNAAQTDKQQPSVGLYTSPHLVQVRERIRLDGKPIDEQRFTHYFWDVWNRLEQNQNRASPSITPVRPVYFRYLTILAFHIFLSLNVKCTILEVGIGGRYDSTNIVKKPVATGITTLGLDHTALLGNTIEEIAVQKAGIYKAGCPAASVWQQSEGARKVVKQEAQKVGVSAFRQLPELSSASAVSRAKLGIPGEHQASNAQLALELYRTYMCSQFGREAFAVEEQVLSDVSDDQLSEYETKGLEAARWPGRCQIVRGGPGESEPTWYLDGAHTAESLQACAAWFVSAFKGVQDVRKVLIFNTTHDRDSETLLNGMLRAIAEERKSATKDLFFDDVIFCTNNTYRQGRSAGDLTAVAGPISTDAQRSIQRAWKALDPQEKTTSHVCESIEEALEQADNTAKTSGNGGTHVLVCGSLHLVGGVMSHLKDRRLLDDALNSLH